MAWTTPKTWTAEVLSSSDLNTHLRDNLSALKDPPSDNYEADEVSDYTTTSTSFVDVDATNLSLTITTGGGDVMVHAHLATNVSTGRLQFNIDVDGSPHAANDGIVVHAAMQHVTSFSRLITGLSAGSHTFKLQWKTSTGGTGTIYAGAGSSGTDVHPQFWVREVS